MPRTYPCGLHQVCDRDRFTEETVPRSLFPDHASCRWTWKVISLVSRFTNNIIIRNHCNVLGAVIADYIIYRIKLDCHL